MEMVVDFELLLVKLNWSIMSSKNETIPEEGYIWLANLLESLRLKEGKRITYKQLAIEMGLTPTSINNYVKILKIDKYKDPEEYERAKVCPNLENLSIIANYIDKPIEYVVACLYQREVSVNTLDSYDTETLLKLQAIITQKLQEKYNKNIIPEA